MGTTRNARLMVGGLLLFFVVQVLAAGYRGQLAAAFSMKLFGLVWLPTIAFVLWRSDVSGAEILRYTFRLSWGVTAASLALAVILPSVAIIDNRRIPIPGVAGRLAGCTPHPNLLAFTAGMCALLAIRLKPRYWQAVITACVVALLLAEARSFTVSFAVVLGLYWLLSGRSTWVRLIAVLPLFFFAGEFFVNDASEAVGGTQIANNLDTLNSRTIVWGMVSASWPKSWLLGWGPAAFSDLRSPLSTSYFLHAHSQFWESIAEGGVLGLLAIVVVALGMLGVMVERRRDAAIPAAGLLVLLTMTNEVPLTAHLFGLSYTLTVAFLGIAVLVAGGKRDVTMAQDAKSEGPAAERDDVFV